MTPTRIRLRLVPSGDEIEIAQLDSMAPKPGSGARDANALVFPGLVVQVATHDARALVRVVRIQVPTPVPSELVASVPERAWGLAQSEMSLQVLDVQGEPVPGAAYDLAELDPDRRPTPCDTSGLIRIDPRRAAERIGWAKLLVGLRAPGHVPEGFDLGVVASSQWSAWAEGKPLPIVLTPLAGPRRSVRVQLVSADGEPLASAIVVASSFPAARLPPARSETDGSLTIQGVAAGTAHLCLRVFQGGAPLGRCFLRVAEDLPPETPLQVHLPPVAPLVVDVPEEVRGKLGLWIVLRTEFIIDGNLGPEGLGPVADLLPGAFDELAGGLEVGTARQITVVAPVGQTLQGHFVAGDFAGERTRVGQEFRVAARASR